MRILHIMAGAEHGGAETYCLDLVTALHHQAPEITQHIITRNFPLRQEKLTHNGISHSFCPFGGFFDFKTARHIEKTIRDFQPDIVQTWMGRASATITLHLRKAYAFRHIGWFGGYYDLKRFQGCDAYVGVTYDIANDIHRRGIAKDKCHTIHTFADLDLNTPPLNRKDYDTPEDAVVFCALARLHKKKGLDTLLHAFHQMPDAESCFLWIAGEGEDRDLLHNLTCRLQLQDRVRFLGWQDNRAAVLGASDICTFPSRYEPFGTVMVEAWATQTPIIAARAAGPKAYMHNGENGLLVDIDDVQGLSNAMHTLKDDRLLQEKLIHGGNNTYQESFTRDVIIRNYQTLYRNLMT